MVNVLRIFFQRTHWTPSRMNSCLGTSQVRENNLPSFYVPHDQMGRDTDEDHQNGDPNGACGGIDAMSDDPSDSLYDISVSRES